MVRICVLLVLALPLFALNLLEYKIHNEQKDNVNITFSFDGVYKAKLDEERDKEALKLTLNGVNYPKEEIKAINSPLITKILISPNSKENKTLVMLEAKSDVRLNTQFINDNTGLMIRALDKTAPLNSSLLSFNQEPQKNSFESKFDYTSYILIISLLLVMLGLLWWISRGLKKGGSTKEFRVLFQRALDRQNKFVVLEFNSKHYIMILGSSNVLLDVVEKDSSKQNIKLEVVEKKPKSFENFFEENKERLQKLIKGKGVEPKN